MGPTDRKGECNMIVNGKKCLKPFVGPPNRKFCDEHSKANLYRGK